MTHSLMDGERRRWDQQPRWAASAREVIGPPLPANQIRSGIDEALRERAYRSSHVSRLLYNPFARRT